MVMVGENGTPATPEWQLPPRESKPALTLGEHIELGEN